MSALNKLFVLIKSLSRSETKYISDHANQDTGYYEIFSQLREMDKPDIRALKLTGVREVTAAHIKNAYEKILQILRNYWGSNSTYADIKDKILESRLLYEKEFYEQSLDALDKAKSNARQLGDTLSQLEINIQELHLHWLVPKEDRRIQDNSSYFEENEHILNLLLQEVKYYKIYYRLLKIVLQKQQLLKEEERIQFKEQFPAYLFQDDKMPESAQGKRRFFLSGALYHQLLGEFDTMYQFFEKVNAWWKDAENAAIRKEHTYWYINDLTNFGYAYIQKKKNEYVEKILTELDQLKKEYKTNAVMRDFLFKKTIKLKLPYYLNTNQYEHIIQLTPEVERNWKLLDERSQMYTCYNFCVCHFMKRNYEQMNKWCEKVVRCDPTLRTDLQLAARLLHLISMLEDENLHSIDQFDSKWKIYHKFFAKVELGLEAQGFHLSALTFLRDIYKGAVNERKVIYQTFYAFLNETDDQSGKGELLYWLTLKLHR